MRPLLPLLPLLLLSPLDGGDVGSPEAYAPPSIDGGSDPLIRLHVAPLSTNLDGKDLYGLFVTVDAAVNYEEVRFASRREPGERFRVFDRFFVAGPPLPPSQRYDGLGLRGRPFQSAHPVESGERRSFRAFVKVASDWFASDIIEVAPPLPGDEPRIAAVRASPPEATQEPNRPENAIDGDLETRWSARSEASGDLGDGTSPVRLEIELDRWHRLDTLYVATYRGDARRWRFRLEAYRAEPPDPIARASPITLVSDTATSGLALGLEPFPIRSSQRVKRLVLTGYGNTSRGPGGAWNSLTELALRPRSP